MADYRLPIFLSLPICHRAIVAAPMLTPLDIRAYLNPDKVEEVTASGESGQDARMCNYEWILSLRQQCVDSDIPFQFHQTGANFIKDGKTYRVPRRQQISQARKAGIDYKIAERDIPASALSQIQPESDEEQLTLI